MFCSTKISIMNIILSCLCNSLHLLFPFARYGIKFFNKNIVWSIQQWQKWPPPLPESTVVCFQVCPLFHASYNSPLGNCVTSRQVTSNQLRPNSFILCANLSFGPILKVTVSQANQLTGINITNSDFGETETKYHLCLILILQIGPDIAPRIANARPDVPRCIIVNAYWRVAPAYIPSLPLKCSRNQFSRDCYGFLSDPTIISSSFTSRLEEIPRCK